MITKLSPSEPRRELSAGYDPKEIEKQVREFYDKVDVGRLAAARLSKKKRIGYVEGPPTLNNQPHIGHVRGRIIKDLWFRRATLTGLHLVFRGGWDTQGLPVELQAEKELGLTGNKWENLKQVGVERLVEACKGLISKYKRDWEETDRLMGLSMDEEKAYMTYRDTFIEREWTYLEKAWKEGLLGEGYKVVPYCPSCQTSLSQAEVALGGYENLDDPSLYYKVRMEDGASLVIWTTMPFTVITDELVAVKPEADYEYVRVGGDVLVVGSERKEALGSELGLKFGETVKTVKGKELQGAKYVHPFLDLVPGLAQLAKGGKIHQVVAEEFVDTSTGSGLVHLSPANGEEDCFVAQRRSLEIFAPFDDQVRFTADAGRFEGTYARDTDAMVTSLLKERGALVHSGRLTHEYPVCWRSGHRLVWLVRREYFYWVDRIRKDLVAAAEKVEYFVEAPKNRFLEFIRVSPPWCVTRERVWGNPLPIWACQECGEKTGAFSRSRMLELAVELPDGPNIELHRPWIDRVVLKCPKCGGKALREPFVLDTWHNSGSAPYSAFTDEEYRELVPVRFLTEGIDQTRGWAYTLLVLNVLKTGKPQAPFEEFLFQGHVLDPQGRKMSKSVGNTIWGLDILRQESADLLRFYMMWKNAPEDSLTMDPAEMKGRPYQVLSTLYHMHVYLLQNGVMDGYDPTQHTVAWARRKKLLTQIDLWALSKLAEAEASTAEAYSKTRYNEACKALEELVISHLSQGYVRLVRPELWRDEAEEKERRLAIYAVLGRLLSRADVLMHPVAPFLTEYLYQKTFAAGGWTAPLVVEESEREPEAEVDGRAVEEVEFALAVEEGVNSARTKARLKRRWPLRDTKVLVQREKLPIAKRAAGMIRALCNVKEVEFVAEPEEFPASFEVVPNKTRVGATFKAKAPEVLKALKALPRERLRGAAALGVRTEGEAMSLETPSGRVEVPSSAFEFSSTPSEGYEVGEKGGYFVAVDSRRDEKLVAEGLMRDVARRVQALRKTQGFSPTAVLERAEVAGLDDDELQMLKPLTGELAFLVRVKAVSLAEEKETGEGWAEEDLYGKAVYLRVG